MNHTDSNRVLGFDLLRGLCAIAVAFYHTLLWSDSYKLPVFATYGVYIFFILSGASMYIAYAPKFGRGYGMHKFILLRFFRLAPLFWLVLIYYYVDGKATVIDMLLNMTFLFSLADPGRLSMATGGWSLGIEFLFYLLFPVFIAVVSNKSLVFLNLAIAVFFQYAFVSALFMGKDDSPMTWNIYNHLLSFIGYFVAGCLIGRIYYESSDSILHTRKILVWALFLTLLGVISFSNEPSAIALLTGAKGLILPLLCMLAVYISSYLYIPKYMAGFVGLLGTVSYGVYLLHPIVYEEFHTVVKYFKSDYPVVGASMLILVALYISFIIDHIWERPIKNFGYRLVNRKV